MPEPRYFDSGPIKPPAPDIFKVHGNDISSVHERDVAARGGGKRVRGSGAKPGRPGDVAGKKDLRECKVTRREKGSFNPKWLEKIALEAIPKGKYPVVEHRFLTLREPAPRDWVTLPAHIYERLKEAYGVEVDG